jgi:serine/threonine protein kinase
VFARKIIRVFGNSTAQDIENEAKAVAALCLRRESKYVVAVIEHGWLTKANMFYFIDMEYCPETLEERILQWKQQSALIAVPQTLASADTGIQVDSEKNDLLPLAEQTSHGDEIDWNPILDIFIDITKGLRYIHTKGFVHRDLKPKNGTV